MKTKLYLTLSITIPLLLASCSRIYVKEIIDDQNFIRKENSKKSIFMVVRDYVALDESSDVFYKKYDFKEEFAHDYLYRFANKLVDRHIFSEEALDKSYKWELAPSAAQFDSLEATYGHMNFDYLLFISDFEVSSNNQTPLPDHTSGNTAYTVKAHMVLYDLKSRKKLLDFTSSGSDFAGAIVVYAPQAALASAINKSIERSIKYLEKKQ